jgi:putative ABC transport system permease protein
MEALLQDLRHAARSLLRAPGFAIITAATLGLGIGATTAVFSIVDGVLLRSLPFPQANRLVDIKQAPIQYLHSGMSGTSPFASFETWRTATQVFDAMATYSGDDAVLTGLGPAEYVMNWHVSANFFSLLGARPVLGRGLIPAEDNPGSPPVAVLSQAFWMSRLGGDPHVLGRTVTLDTVAYTVVGVTAGDFRYPAGANLWSNLGSLLTGPTGVQQAREWRFWVLGRLQRGVTLSKAQATLEHVTQQAWSSEPQLNGMVPVARMLHSFLLLDLRAPLWIMLAATVLVLLAATVLVLLVACANVSSLLLARATDKEREMAVRATLGAGTGRLARQVLSESVLIAVAGGAIGIVLAIWSVPTLLALAGSEVPRIRDIGVDLRVLVTTIAICLASGMLAGLFPALRTARRPPADALKGPGPGTTRQWRSRPAGVLVMAQVALTLMLLTAAGLLLRSFDRLVHVDAGFDPRHVVAAELHLPSASYHTPAAEGAFIRQSLDRARSLPGVTLVAAASGMPLAGGEVSTVSEPGLPEQRFQTVAWVSAVTQDYFRILAIPVLRGRLPVTGDEAVIDSVAARTFFHGLDPLGRALGTGGYERLTVVGLVGDTRQESLAEAPPAHIYPALLPAPTRYFKILIRTNGDPDRAAGELRRGLQAVDATVPLDRVAPLTMLMHDSLAQQRLYTWLLAIFAGAALLLAATGLYGLSSYAVVRRTREIGIRIALGADSGAVLGLVVGRGLLLTAGGIVVGVVGALAMTRLLQRYLFEVTPTDPGVLALVALLLLSVATVASFVPARQAVRVDPLVALRTE